MRCRAAILGVLGLAFLATLGKGASEYQVKAAYVFNFTKFVDWPGLESLSSFTICICGKDPFGGFLDQTVYGKLTHGLPVVIRRLPITDGGWEECQVLFFGAGNPAARLDSTFKRLQSHHILTIGDSDGFTERGGMLELLIDHGRVHFAINVEAIIGAHLQASSQLIELGRVVGVRK